MMAQIIVLRSQMPAASSTTLRPAHRRTQWAPRRAPCSSAAVQAGGPGGAGCTGWRRHDATCQAAPVTPATAAEEAVHAVGLETGHQYAGRHVDALQYVAGARA